MKLLRAVDRRDVAQWSGTGHWLAGYMHLSFRIQDRGNGLGEFQDADVVGGTDVDWDQRWSAEEHRPQPDCEVSGVQVGAPRRAVACNLDGAAGQYVPDEVPDGEVSIERKMWSGEGPAAGNGAFDTSGLVEEGAHQLGGTFAFRIDTGGIERIRSAGVGLSKMGNVGGLFPIDSAGAGEQEAEGAM